MKHSLRASGPISSWATGTIRARGNGWNSLIGNGLEQLVYLHDASWLASRATVGGPARWADPSDARTGGDARHRRGPTNRAYAVTGPASRPRRPPRLAGRWCPGSMGYDGAVKQHEGGAASTGAAGSTDPAGPMAGARAAGRPRATRGRCVRAAALAAGAPRPGAGGRPGGRPSRPPWPAALAWWVATTSPPRTRRSWRRGAAVLVVHSTIYKAVTRGTQQVAGHLLRGLHRLRARHPARLGSLGVGLPSSWATSSAAALGQGGGQHDRHHRPGHAATGSIAQPDLLASRLIDTAVGVGVGLASTCWSGRRCATGRRGRTPSSCPASSPRCSARPPRGWARTSTRRRPRPGSATSARRRPHRRGVAAAVAGQGERPDEPPRSQPTGTGS